MARWLDPASPIARAVSASIAVYRHQARLFDNSPDGKSQTSMRDCHVNQILAGAGTMSGSDRTSRHQPREPKPASIDAKIEALHQLAACEILLKQPPRTIGMLQ
jgi:hypothetical protein